MGSKIVIFTRMTTLLPRNNDMSLPDGVAVLGKMTDSRAEILTPEALAFVATLARNFSPRVLDLLDKRKVVQTALDAGENLHFLQSTASIREGDWRVASIPRDLEKRHVEITGPVERKMIINALNSGADVFMADLEDSNSPTWANVVDGQTNLRDAVAGTIEFQHPTRDKTYRLDDVTATLMVRPRGWHLWEHHVLVDDRPVPAGLFDFGLFFFHNARALVEKGSGPYFYLPKLESHLEARLWNDVFVAAQDAIGLPVGTVRATVLIETIPAAFEMDEILYELRAHSAGLNCGRWDYIFSYIKKHARRAEFVIPDRGQVGMTQPFMAAYSQLVIKTCHRRGAHAMGGMAAQIPIKSDAAANEAALNKVRADKLREARDGHDGTWVAHPGLVPIAREIFAAQVAGAHQIATMPRLDVDVSAADLLAVPTGTRTLDGLRLNVRVGVQYLAAWLDGNGCVPLYNLMEDAATAEISRTQVWQWLRHGASLDTGELVTSELFLRVVSDEMEAIKGELGLERFSAGRFADAEALFTKLCTDEEFVTFLTLPAYEQIIERA